MSSMVVSRYRDVSALARSCFRNKWKGTVQDERIVKERLKLRDISWRHKKNFLRRIRLVAQGCIRLRENQNQSRAGRITRREMR